jgi:sulfatase modifying factor 1
MRYVFLALSLLVTGCTSFAFRNSGKGTAPSELMSRDAMVKIPGGTFDMGAQNAEPDEYPPHKVEVSGFLIDKFEVTVGDYARCIDAKVCRKLPEFDEDENAPELTTPEKHPVASVSWFDANKYCEWVGKRLPTEAEWEYAARAPKMEKFPWVGMADDTRANSAGSKDGFPKTAPVGSFPKGASGYGVMDMSGNVAEWTNDWYDAKWYDHSPGTNPKGPEAPTGSKVVRGGSWTSNGDYLLRSTSRVSLEPNISNDGVGFRCAADK